MVVTYIKNMHNKFYFSFLIVFSAIICSLHFDFYGLILINETHNHRGAVAQWLEGRTGGRGVLGSNSAGGT